MIQLNSQIIQRKCIGGDDAVMREKNWNLGYRRQRFEGIHKERKQKREIRIRRRLNGDGNRIMFGEIKIDWIYISMERDL